MMKTLLSLRMLLVLMLASLVKTKDVEPLRCFKKKKCNELLTVAFYCFLQKCGL